MSGDKTEKENIASELTTKSTNERTGIFGSSTEECMCSGGEALAEAEADEPHTNTEDDYEDISEAEALKKYSMKNTKIDKGAQMLLGAFKTSVKDINYDRAVSLCSEIAKHIFEKGEESFPKIVRSKAHNLKENAKLCLQVYAKKVSPVMFVEMSATEMRCDELRSKDEVAIKDSLLAAQVAEAVAETEMFQCQRCKKRKCTYTQLQTRSCDEPMTTFVHCTNCGNRWRF